ncbi:MAG: hypothetical protein ACJ8OJ_20830 [Povalibacter sp.]|jgi:hypothetical protein
MKLGTATVSLSLVALVVLSGCAAKNTKVIAQDKEFVPPAAAAPWKIGGVFDEEEYTVVISFNGENVLRGRFPPYTPRLTAEGKYLDKAVATVCMFSSGVIGKSGWQVQLAEAIVSKATKNGGNSCEVTVDGQAAATLYF